tara:strand:+ start:309 stop:932 length:624 start_codon:yes stop_codon:yes gene_type:complete
MINEFTSLKEELDIMKKVGSSGLRPSMQTLIGKKDLIGLEIGLGGGHHAANIITHLDIKKLYIIENQSVEMRYGHDDFNRKRFPKGPEFIPHLRDQDNVKIFDKTDSQNPKSAGLIPEGLDFIYVDGDHYAEGVQKDMDIWPFKVKKGGLIAGHDYHVGGVKDVVNKFAQRNGYKVGWGPCEDFHVHYRTSQSYKKREVLDWYLIKK